MYEVIKLKKCLYLFMLMVTILVFISCAGNIQGDLDHTNTPWGSLGQKSENDKSVPNLTTQEEDDSKEIRKVLWNVLNGVFYPRGIESKPNYKVIGVPEGFELFIDEGISLTVNREQYYVGEEWQEGYSSVPDINLDNIKFNWHEIEPDKRAEPGCAEYYINTGNEIEKHYIVNEYIDTGYSTLNVYPGAEIYIYYRSRKDSSLGLSGRRLFVPKDPTVRVSNFNMDTLVYIPDSPGYYILPDAVTSPEDLPEGDRWYGHGRFFVMTGEIGEKYQLLGIMTILLYYFPDM